MEELDIVELLYALKKRIKYIVIAVVVCALMGLVYSKFLIKPMYKSSTSFILTKSSTEKNQEEAITTSDITLNSKLVSTYSEMIRSKKIAKAVIASLGLDMKESEFISNISVSSKSDTELIVITVVNPDSIMAADIANSLAEVFRDEVNEAYKIDNLYVIDIAEPTSVPYNIGTVKNIAIFALVGLVAACGVIFLVVYFDDTVKDERDIETIIGTPVIATIPRMEDKDEGGFLKWKKAK